MRTTKDGVQRRSVDDKHAEACACYDSREVVVVANDGLAEGEGELGFHGEDLRRTISMGLIDLVCETLTLKH